jgi:hypothetical protein
LRSEQSFHVYVIRFNRGKPRSAALVEILAVTVVVAVGVLVAVHVNRDERKVRGDVGGPCVSRCRQLPAASHTFHPSTSRLWKYSNATFTHKEKMIRKFDLH